MSENGSSCRLYPVAYFLSFSLVAVALLGCVASTPGRADQVVSNPPVRDAASGVQTYPAGGKTDVGTPGYAQSIWEKSLAEMNDQEKESFVTAIATMKEGFWRSLGKRGRQLAIDNMRAYTIESSRENEKYDQEVEGSLAKKLVMMKLGLSSSEADQYLDYVRTIVAEALREVMKGYQIDRRGVLSLTLDSDYDRFWDTVQDFAILKIPKKYSTDFLRQRVSDKVAIEKRRMSVERELLRLDRATQENQAGLPANTMIN
jgi:hypothetical protein